MNEVVDGEGERFYGLRTWIQADAVPVVCADVGEGLEVVIHGFWLVELALGAENWEVLINVVGKSG